MKKYLIYIELIGLDLSWEKSLHERPIFQFEKSHVKSLKDDNICRNCQY